MIFINSAASICRRVSLRELITEVPAYTGSSISECDPGKYKRGTRFHPGDYVGIGKDHTLFALKEGRVSFEKNKITGRKWIHVDPKDGHVLHPIYIKAAAAKLTMTETATSS